MNILLILFDQNVMPSDAVQAIVNYLKQYGNWARLTPSSWLIKTPKTTADVRDDLIPFSRGYKVAVFNVTNSGWGTNFSDEVTNWLKQK